MCGNVDYGSNGFSSPPFHCVCGLFSSLGEERRDLVQGLKRSGQTRLIRCPSFSSSSSSTKLLKKKEKGGSPTPKVVYLSRRSPPLLCNNPAGVSGGRGGSSEEGQKFIEFRTSRATYWVAPCPPPPRGRIIYSSLSDTGNDNICLRNSFCLNLLAVPLKKMRLRAVCEVSLSPQGDGRLDLIAKEICLG